VVIRYHLPYKCDINNGENSRISGVWKFTALLQQILKSHEPIHIHGNNDGPTLRIQGAIWPSIIEVSFRKKSAMSAKEFNFGPWPHQLDRPNNPARPDLYLEPFFGKSANYRPF